MRLRLTAEWDENSMRYCVDGHDWFSLDGTEWVDGCGLTIESEEFLNAELLLIGGPCPGKVG